VTEGTLLSYRYTRRLSTRVDLTAGAVYDRNQYDTARSQDIQLAGNAIGARTSAFVKSTVKIGSRLTVDLGTDYDVRKSIESVNYRRDTGEVTWDNNLSDRSVHEYSGYGEGTYRFSHWLSLVGGSRLTKNALFGANMSSRVAAIYTPRERHSIKIFWGQAFRAPSLSELYRRSETGGVYGNEDLHPETSESVEAAYVTSFGGLLLKGSVYHVSYDHKIARVPRYPDFVSDPADVSIIYNNSGNFSAKGAEIELTYDVPAIGHAFMNVGYIHGNRGDALPGSNNYNFRYIPEGSVAAGASRQLGAFSVAVVTRWLEATNGFLAPVASHTTADITVGYDQRAGAVRLRHSLFAKDLFGRGAQTPEYLRGHINSVPLGLEPRLGYRLQLSF
jgi:outer membrane receptor protein involved in Fe transport